MDYTIEYVDGEPRRITTDFLVTSLPTSDYDEVMHGELQGGVLKLLREIGDWHFAPGKYLTVITGSRRIPRDEGNTLDHKIFKDEITQVQRQVSSVVLELLRFQKMQKIIEEVKK